VRTSFYPLAPLLSLSVVACASLPPEPPGRPSTLWIDGSGDGYVTEVARETDGRIVATCTHPPCALPVETGRYELRVRGDGTTPDRSHVIEVRSAGTRAEIRDGSSVSRGVGAFLGVTGPIAMGVGFFTGACMDTGPNDQSWGCSGKPIALALGGMLATVIGWVMFGTSNTKIVTFQATPQPHRYTSSRGLTLFEF
jgi:hypothetical protein